MTKRAEPAPCPLCRRPNLAPSDHHLVPKSRGGTAVETICRDCHHAIHATLTNRELEDEYHTPEALLSYEPLRRMIAFIAKQDPGGKVKVRTASAKRLRGK